MKETSVLNFTVSSGSSDIGLVEIDPILNVDSEGNAKSSFSEGEEIYIAVHFDPDKYVLSNFLRQQEACFMLVSKEPIVR